MPQELPVPADPSILGNLEPDLVLPEQFFPEQQPHWSGELALLWTVFWDGIESFRKEVILGRERGEAFVETIAWIARTDDDSIFSFDRLCELFRLRPERVRRSLAAWREQHRAATAVGKAA
ncbi:MAG: hypothetical protein ACREQQ_12510 [Candidatus Binatia bacterium]